MIKETIAFTLNSLQSNKKRSAVRFRVRTDNKWLSFRSFDRWIDFICFCNMAKKTQCNMCSKHKVRFQLSFTHNVIKKPTTKFILLGRGFYLRVKEEKKRSLSFVYQSLVNILSLEIIIEINVSIF
jgi:hypothetical protein